MRVFVSIVSHHNSAEIIHDLQAHQLKSSQVQPVILDNIPDPALAGYCHKYQLEYLSNNQAHGFGHNHNRVFQHCRKHLGLQPEDCFIVLNPDMLCSATDLVQLAQHMHEHDAQIAAPDLYRDRALQQRENAIRRFPYLWDTLISWIWKGRRVSIDRSLLDQPTAVDWASGACLAIRADLYQALNGFDERYYLYYEDVDLCWRARHTFQQPVIYFPTVRAVHVGWRVSHKLFTRHLLWHISSALRFAWVRVKTALHQKP